MAMPPELPSHLKERVPEDGCDLIAVARSIIVEEFFEQKLIEAFKKSLGGYPPEWSTSALYALLRFLLEAGREIDGFKLTIEEWTEELGRPDSDFARTTVEAFADDAIEHFRSRYAQRGKHWFARYLPDVPEGTANVSIAARPLFRRFLEVYCELRAQEGAGNLMSECWSQMTDTHRREPYATQFCEHFGLPLPGAWIDKHTLDRPVGVGGMGVIYLARHDDGYSVALKIMRPDCGDRDRFVLEARNAVESSDPSLVTVRVTDVRPQTRLPYYTMTYVVGGRSLSDLISFPSKSRKLVDSLSQQLRVRNPLTRPRFGWPPQRGREMKSIHGERFYAAIVTRIARAAHVLHDRGRGFVHCDIKPGNVLISRKHGPLLSDLGLSCRLVNGKTEASEFVGTREYASPEQIAGQSLTVESDIYQLGKLLNRCLTKSVPVEPLHPAGASTQTGQRTERQTPSPRGRGGSAHRRLRAIVKKALDVDPTKRYRTAAAMADDLDRFLQGRPVRARWGYRWKQPLHQILSTSIGWGALIILLLAAFIVRQQWLGNSDLNDVRAAQNQYRTHDIVEGVEPVLSDRPSWPNPTYENITILSSSIVFDLSRWKPARPEEVAIKQIEPALYTRVITLRKCSPLRPGDPCKVSFQFRTEGCDVRLRCKGFPPDKVKVFGPTHRVEFKGKMVIMRQIDIDIGDAPIGKVLDIDIQGTIWNGFQQTPSGKQWAAFLSPDTLQEGELAIVFPKGCRPTKKPDLARKPWESTVKTDSLRDKASTKPEPPPKPEPLSEVIDETCPDRWIWHPYKPQRDFLYWMEFEWRPLDLHPERFRLETSSVPSR